jgi:hypothetical protein
MPSPACEFWSVWTIDKHPVTACAGTLLLLAPYQFVYISSPLSIGISAPAAALCREQLLKPATDRRKLSSRRGSRMAPPASRGKFSKPPPQKHAPSNPPETVPTWALCSGLALASEVPWPAPLVDASRRSASPLSRLPLCPSKSESTSPRQWHMQATEQRVSDCGERTQLTAG